MALIITEEQKMLKDSATELSTCQSPSKSDARTTRHCIYSLRSNIVGRNGCTWDGLH